MTGQWQHARRILAVRLDALGDVLMTGPAIRALAGDSALREVTLLTSPAGAEAASLLPGVSSSIVYEAPWMKASSPRITSATDFELIDRLRRAEFDAAVIFTVFSQNPLPAALTCYLAGIPLRLAHCRENPYYLLTDWVRESEPDREIRHEVRRQLDLVATVGAVASDDRMRIRLPKNSQSKVRRKLSEIGVIADRPWVVVHPGASAPSRRYPPSSFAAACAQLVEQHSVQVVFTGSNDDVPLVESIRVEMGADSHSLAGKLSLAELGALLSLAPLLVSNNTGPVHVAASVDCPVVDLYALTNPYHTPWMVPARVLNRDVPCKYCYSSVCPQVHNECLTLVPPAEVAASAIDLLQVRAVVDRIGVEDVYARA